METGKMTVENTNGTPPADAPPVIVTPEVEAKVEKEAEHIADMQRSGASDAEILTELRAMPDRISSLVSEAVGDALKPLTRAARAAAAASAGTPAEPTTAPVEGTPTPDPRPAVKRGPFARMFDGSKW